MKYFDVYYKKPKRTNPNETKEVHLEVEAKDEQEAIQKIKNKIKTNNFDITERSWYYLEYHCPECDEDWDDEWDCMVDSQCPECGQDYSPKNATEQEFPDDYQMSGYIN